MKLKILRETTTYSAVSYRVPRHDYLVEGGHGGRLIAVRKENGHAWEKFTRPLPFGKKQRTFKELREEIPKEFSVPFMTDPWKTNTYNSLEAFMS